jgi:hypothetical protein
VQWEHVGMSSTGFANGEPEVVGTLREGKAYNPYHSDPSGCWQSGYAAAFRLDILILL